MLTVIIAIFIGICETYLPQLKNWTWLLMLSVISYALAALGAPSHKMPEVPDCLRYTTECLILKQIPVVLDNFLKLKGLLDNTKVDFGATKDHG